MGVKKLSFLEQDVKLKRQDEINEAQLKLRTDFISKKNLLKKSFNDACLIDFGTLNLRKAPAVALRQFEGETEQEKEEREAREERIKLGENNDQTALLSNKERRIIASREARKKEVIHRRLFDAKQNDSKYSKFQDFLEK